MRLPRAALGAGTITVLVASLMPVLLSGVGAHAADNDRKPRTGTVTVTVKGPAGVPGLVRLRSGTKVRAVTKKPAGTVRTVKVKLPPGRWSVTAPQVVDDSALYTATVSRRAVRVRAGRTAAVAVTFRRAPSVSGLQVERIESALVGLTWTGPAGGASYLVRRGTGRSLRPPSPGALRCR
ncbi:hypothetical protein [Nocardioides sambongensis]|uniref:hypothetical protein n=1 Tax=Nocardioides sambongensis TaxID=2589074 RepID=UPI00112A3E68|nr:hypothetical protein [Nocardioides sambongensis]